MKKLFLLILLILLINNCSPLKWTHGEKTLAKTFIAGQSINYGQINYIKQNNEPETINPIVRELDTKSELIAYKAISTGFVLTIADNLSHKWRENLLWASNFIVWGFAGHDMVVGVGIEF